MGHDVVSLDDAVAWLESNAPDALDDLRLLGAHRFGGDTPVSFILAAAEKMNCERVVVYESR